MSTNAELTKPDERTDETVVSIKSKAKPKRAKNGAERQKSLYQRKTAAGYRKGWIDPETLAAIVELGSIEKLSLERAEHKKRIAELSKRVEELEAEVVDNDYLRTEVNNARLAVRHLENRGVLSSFAALARAISKSLSQRKK